MNETKLYAAAAIFLAITVAKILAPEFISDVKIEVDEKIDESIDYAEAMSTLQSVADEYSFLWSLSSSETSSQSTSYVSTPELTVFDSEPFPTIIVSPIPSITTVELPEPKPEVTPEVISESSADDLPFEYIEPLAIEVSSPFGNRIHPVYGDERFHYGIDISALSGAPIEAFSDGIVTISQYSDSYGYYIVVEHNESYSTLYAHCSELFAVVGQTVSMGEIIASVGSTGISTGPHLHFELIENGERIDPAEFLC